MFNKVFISYASEDFSYAEKLYHYLEAGGYKVWLDKKSIKPGQQWDFEIKQGLKNADFIIILLSSNSVNKRGYVQREFKLALEYMEERLDSDIYIIPVKIDACDVPDKLSRHQWVIYSESAFAQILGSLNHQQGVLMETFKKKARS